MDTDFVPTGSLRLEAIIASVVKNGDLAETGALEAKSSINLTKKLGQAKVAKFILAASNRRPSDAQRHFKGYAVMVLGAALGQEPGIAQQAVVESHQLADALRLYLGAAQTRWDLVHFPKDGRDDVLIIIVDPPAAGDPPFPCCKDLQLDRPEQKHSLQDGAVYVRDRTNTRLAKGTELTALHERGRNTVTPQVTIDVEFNNPAISLDKAPEVLAKWLEMETKRYRDKRSVASEKEQSPSLVSPSILASLYGSVDTAMGKKSTSEIITDWETTTRRDWSERMDGLAGSSGPPITVGGVIRWTHQGVPV